MPGEPAAARCPVVCAGLSFPPSSVHVCAPPRGAIQLPNFDMLKYFAVFASSSMIYLTGVIAVYLFISADRNMVPVWQVRCRGRLQQPRRKGPHTTRLLIISHNPRGGVGCSSVTEEHG